MASDEKSTPQENNDLSMNDNDYAKGLLLPPNVIERGDDCDWGDDLRNLHGD